MEYIFNILLRHGLYYVDTSCETVCANYNRGAWSAQTVGIIVLWDEKVGHVSDDVLKNLGSKETWTLRELFSRKNETKGLERQKSICWEIAGKSALRCYWTDPFNLSRGSVRLHLRIRQISQGVSRTLKSSRIDTNDRLVVNFRSDGAPEY